MSVLVPKIRTAFMGGFTGTTGYPVDLDLDTIKMSIGRQSAYTYSGTDRYKSSVTTVQDGSAALSSITLATPNDGTFDAADVTFTAVPAGAALDFLEIWKDTGSAATSALIAYIDGFSIVPNGGDITVVFDNGTARIFEIG